MSRQSRRGESLAPTLFPFLAVLLCTMGSLVLILMLIVSGAQAETQQAVEEQQEALEDKKTLIELAAESYQEQLEEGTIELEKNRLVLQHLESHIQELLTELEELKATAARADTQSDENLAEDSDYEKQLSELEKQLAEAKAELAQELEDPDGDKPIFAIIPYEGQRGTHRRPIYVECTEEGVIIQPEGVLIPLADLQPPYGPGNPLDAALRTIRAAFPPANGAVTSTAYPLLIVRPRGVRTYSRVRAAMSGWDDQFGYELIDDELELAFPPVTPGLEDKIAKTIELARQRQSALVAAMPGKYRMVAGGRNSNGTGGSGTAQGSASNSSWGSGVGRGSAGSSATAPFAFGPANGDGFGAAPNQYATQSTDPRSSWGPAEGYGGQANGGLTGGSLDPREESQASLFGSNTGRDSLSRPGSVAQAALGTASSGQSNLFSSDQSAAGSGQSGLTNSGDSPSGSTAGAAGSANSSLVTNQNRQQPQNGVPGGMAGMGSPEQRGGAQLPIPSIPGLQPQIAGANAANGSASGAAGQFGARGRETEVNRPSDGSAGGSSSSRGSGGNGNSSSPRLDAIASRQGQDWAWRDRSLNQTAIVRRVKLNCFADRWELPPESDLGGKAIVIPFTGVPQDRAIELARAIQQRVESWGFAVSNGYWKPVLSVSVAPDAQWRYTQLTQLFEGSGIEILKAARPAGGRPAAARIPTRGTR